MTEWSPCRLSGPLPQGLIGTYFRIGPHPLPGAIARRWGAHPGLLHAIRMDAGGAAWHTASRMAVEHGPGANLLVDCGELLAAGESGPVWAIDKDGLNAAARPLTGGRATTVPHAHPDSTGRLVVTALDEHDPVVSCWSWVAGEWQLRRVVDVPDRSFLHDAQIVNDQLVLGMHPLRHSPTGPRWDAAKESSVWLIAPLDSNERPSLVESAPCFVLHGGTATSDAREVLLRAPVRPTPGLARDEPVLDPSVVPGMREWRLDRIRGTATERQLTYDPCDFPVELDGDLIVGLAGERDGGPDYTRCRGVARVGPSGELDRRLHLRGSFGGEFRPVMTDDGMVLAGLITWPDASELLILDPSDLSAEPLARVHVPVAIAAGLHSAWLPGE